MESKETFDNIDIWLKELKTHANPDAKVFIIGNKLDLENKRQVPKDLALKYKNDFGLDFHMECSALSGFNARDVFIEATKMLYKDYLNYKPSVRI
jgi:GTPase SAR1 family protein